MSNTAGSDRSQTAPRAGGRAQGTASPPTSGSPCSLAFLLFFFFSPCAHGHTKGWVIRDVILEINRVPSAAPAQAQMPHAVHDVGAVCPLSEARCCRSYKGLTHSSTPNPYVPHEMLRAKCPSAPGPGPHSPTQRCSCLCGSCLLISSPPSPAGGFSSLFGAPRAGDGGLGAGRETASHGVGFGVGFGAPAGSPALQERFVPAEQLRSPSSPQQGAALETFSLLTPTCLPKTPLLPPQPGRRTLFSSRPCSPGARGARTGLGAAGRAPAASCWGPCRELVPAVLAQGSAAEPAPAPPAAPSPDKAAQTRPCLTRGPFPGRAAMSPVFPGWENITCSSQPLLFH